MARKRVPFLPGVGVPNEPVPDSFSFDTPRDPQWYKHAVFYEVLVRGFHDSNGDGTGDIRGLKPGQVRAGKRHVP